MSVVREVQTPCGRCWYRFDHSCNGITSQAQHLVTNRGQAHNVEFYLPPEVQQNFYPSSVPPQQFQPQQDQPQVFYQHTSPATHFQLYIPNNSQEHNDMMNLSVSNVTALNTQVSSNASSKVGGANVARFQIQEHFIFSSTH